jgi:hypothetical protein
MVKKIAIGLVVVLALLAAFIASRPAAFHVERSRELPVPPAAAFAQVNDFHAWAAWSPWEKLDPAMQKTFAGPASGVGAEYGWKGNDKVGEGKMTLTASEPAQKVGIRLEFIKPFAAVNQTGFTFAPTAQGTKVTWAMDGENNFIGKAFCLVMDMDKTIGGDFERGLAGLEAAAKASVAAAPAKAAEPVKVAEPAK